jgi:hypothetical protein
VANKLHEIAEIKIIGPLWTHGMMEGNTLASLLKKTGIKYMIIAKI